MKSLLLFLHLWGPVILWAGLIFFLSSLSTLPSAPTVWWDILFKKTAHVTEYAILYFLLIRALKHRTNRNYLLAFIIAVTYALLDEYHQSFTPGRHPHPLDVGIDTFGILISYVLIKFYLPRPSTPRHLQS